VEAFRATTLTLGWDADAGLVLVEARAEPIEVEIEADDDDDDDEAEADADDDEEGSVELDASLAASILAAFETSDDEDGPDVLRVRVTAATARSFVRRAAEVIASGRPPCPLCGQPLDKTGHICPRRNGHYVN
jgi:hypothetical protein